MICHGLAALAALLWMTLGSLAQADDLIVEKKTFTLPSYTTVAGETIKSVKVGWESAGTLNADKSNAVLITHFFSGTSHAFGKYAAEDKTAGYWDAIIGPGKAIDTNKYFVLSSDTLVNLNVNMPNVVTTGPASIDPDTGKPYGLNFPVVSIKDFVKVEKDLVDSLGIKKLKAVVGASMGGLQAYEWAQTYPDSVDRIVAVVAYATPEPYLIAWLDMWAQPIRLDPKWNNGDYYGKAPPLDGLKAALKLVTLRPTVGNGRARLSERRPLKRARIRAKPSPTNSKSKVFSTRPRPRAPVWPMPIIFFIFARRINSPPSIRQTSKRRHLYFMRQTIWYFMNRSSARPWKKSPRRAARSRAVPWSGPTATLMPSPRSDRAPIRLRHSLQNSGVQTC
jgi:homoserine acetyltransferase